MRAGDVEGRGVPAARAALERSESGRRVPPDRFDLQAADRPGPPNSALPGSAIDEAWMRSAKIRIVRRDLSKRKPVFLVELEGPAGLTRRGVFRVSAGDLTSPVNDVAASNVITALGRGGGGHEAGNIVPLTILRTLSDGGEELEGALTLFSEDYLENKGIYRAHGKIRISSSAATDASITVSGVKGYDSFRLDRARAEKLRIFVFGFGEYDCGDRNIGLGPEGPNGRESEIWSSLLAFNKVGKTSIWTLDRNFFWGTERLPLLDDTYRYAQSLDLEKIAEALAKSGMDVDNIRLSLRRFKHIQLDPRIIEINRPDIGQLINLSAESPDEALTAGGTEEVDTLVAKVTRLQA
jgi:hypothetical protein